MQMPTIIIGCCMSLVIIAVIIYMFIYFCHPNDKSYGNKWFPKLLVMSGLFLAMFQPQLVVLDIINARTSSNLNIDSDWSLFYEINFFVIIIYLSILLPIGLFCYQANPEDPVKEQALDIGVKIFLYLLGQGLFIGIGYLFNQNGYVPFQSITKDFNADVILEDGNSLSKTAAGGQIIKNQKMEVQMNFIEFYIGAFSSFGAIFSISFAAIGIIALPKNMIMYYVNRPQQRNTRDMVEKKTTLREHNDQLIEQGKSIHEEEKRLTENPDDESKIIIMKKKKQLRKQCNVWLKAVQDLQEQYNLFKQELDLSEVNPLVFIAALILGILCVAFSLNWLLIISTYYLAGDTGYSHDFTRFLESIEETDTAILSYFMFMIFSYYLYFASVYGYSSVSVRVPYLFSFQFVKKDETYLDSFIVYTIVLLINSLSIMNIITIVFSQYCRFTSIQRLYKLVNSISIFNTITHSEFLGWMFTAIIVLNLLSILISQCNQHRKNKQNKTKQVEMGLIKK